MIRRSCWSMKRHVQDTLTHDLVDIGLATHIEVGEALDVDPAVLLFVYLKVVVLWSERSRIFSM